MSKIKMRVIAYRKYDSMDGPVCDFAPRVVWMEPSETMEYVTGLLDGSCLSGASNDRGCAGEGD